MSGFGGGGPGIKARDDFPCYSCLQRMTKRGAISPKNSCTFTGGESTCDYCEEKGKSSQCERIPTPFRKQASELLDLVDLVLAEDTTPDIKIAATEDIRHIRNALRAGWARFHKNIRNGKHSWEQLQDWEVDRYSQRMVESFLETAEAKKAGVTIGDGHGEMSRDLNSPSDDGRVNDTALGEDANSSGMFLGEGRALRSITGRQQARQESVDISKFTTTVNNTLISMAENKTTFQEDMRSLLGDIIQLQRELIQGQKDMIASHERLAEYQKEVINDMRDRMPIQMAANPTATASHLSPTAKSGSQEPCVSNTSLNTARTPEQSSKGFKRKRMAWVSDNSLKEAMVKEKGVREQPTYETYEAVGSLAKRNLVLTTHGFQLV